MRFDVYAFDDDDSKGQVLVADRDGEVDPDDIVAALQNAGFLAGVDPDDIDVDTDGDDSDTLVIYDDPDSDDPVLELVETDVIDVEADVIDTARAP